MNKAHLIDAVAFRMGGIPRAQAERAVNEIFSAVTEGLVTDGSVQIVGFGAWTVRNRAARMGRNPRTGEPVPIPAGRAVSFKAGKGLKDSLKN